ncbi:MAG: type II toxin-antitoxin system prevent-host-death family antitoxin [Vicinamibacteria bacterium]|nr:type II toxin-antitoxin system prevent-host-death family antitoxin [Vicinamibacteria bacterium]
MKDRQEGPVAWSVAEAKQRLSEVLRNAAREPQAIRNRSRDVAVVVSAEEFGEFAAWRASRRARTVGAAFAEFRALAADDGYQLPVSRRANRRDGFSGRRK